MDWHFFPKKIIKNLIATLLLCLLLIILFRLSPQLTGFKIFVADDFVEYWAAGRINLTGGNPYNPAELLPLQSSVGWQQKMPIMMWNPPWTLPLVMPFGSLDYPLGRFLWFLSHTAILVFCAFYLWRYYGGSHNKAWVAILVSFTFLPSLVALKIGQITALLLLGVVFFLMWIERQNWWLLSLAILLMIIKPHTLYLVIVAFFSWSFYNHRWGHLVSGVMGIALAIGIAMIFNSTVLLQYFYALDHYSPSQWATPTIGGVLRFFLGVDRVWLQFLPTLLGALWFFLYCWKERLTWNWNKQLPLLLTVSVLTSSYGWTFDYVVLLLPILCVAIVIMRRKMNWASILLLITYVAIEIQVLVQQRSSNYFWLMWLAPALAGWYFLAMRWRMAAGQALAGVNETLEKNFSSLTFPSGLPDDAEFNRSGRELHSDHGY